MFYSFNKRIASFASSKSISLISNKTYIIINNTILQQLIKIDRIGDFCSDIGVIQPNIKLIINEYTDPNIGFLNKEKRNTHKVQLEKFKYVFNKWNTFQNVIDWNGEIDLYMLENNERPITQKWLPIINDNK
jgi:hypothetical protein